MTSIPDKSDLEIKQEFMVKFLEKINETGDSNARDKARLAEENTYRSSHLYITINFGIIAAASFVFGKEKILNPVSQFLSIFLVCSVIAILLEILYRKKIIEANIKLFSERVKEMDKIQTEFMQALPENLNKSTDEYCKNVDGFNTKYNKIIDEIDEKLKKWDKELAPYRKWSFVLTILSISSLTLVLIIESGAPQIIIRLLTNLKNIIAPFHCGFGMIN